MAKAKPSLLISEWSRAAQIFRRICFDEVPHFGSVLRRCLRGCEPALDLRNNPSGDYSVDFNSRIAEKTKQFAQRQSSNMGQVAQDFNAMLISCACGMLTGNYIFHYNRSPRPAHPPHLGDDALRLCAVVHRKPTDDQIELAIGEGKLLHIAGYEGQMCYTVSTTTLLREPQGCFREIDSNHLTTNLSECFSDIAGATSHIQHPIFRFRGSGRHQARNSFRIRNPRLGCVGRSLYSKRLPYNIIVMRHDPLWST